MDLMNELIVSVVGGVVTAIILESFRGGQRSDKAPTNDTPAVAVGPKGRPLPLPKHNGRGRQEQRQGRSRIGAFFSGLLRVILAVCGGLLVATLGFRMAIAAELIERGPAMRMAFFIAGTIVFWVLLLVVRGRR